MALTLSKGSLDGLAGVRNPKLRHPAFTGPGMRRRITTAMAGEPTPEIVETVRAMASGTRHRTDEVTDALLEACGVDSDLIMVLSSISSPMTLLDGDGIKARFTKHGGHVALAHECGGYWIYGPRWNVTRSSIEGAATIPETIASMACGLPLEAILHHPVLAKMKLMVKAIERDRTGGSIIHVSDSKGTPVGGHKRSIRMFTEEACA